MSKSSASGFGFQGGAYVEIFTPQGKDPTSNWKVTGSVKKIFDKEVKSYIYVLEGVPTTTKMQLPKDARSTVTLVQRYLILQICLSKGQDFSIELGLTDLGKNKRRILLSTSQRDMQATPLHAKIPLSIVKRGIWLNLCLDLTSLVADTWRGQTFRSAECLTVSANCKLRRVFTMKAQPIDTTEDDAIYGMSNAGEIDQIPKSCQLATDVSQVTQVLTVNKLKIMERLKPGDGSSRPTSMLELDLNSSDKRSSITDPNNYHIAFGSKVAVPTARKSGKDSLVSNRTARSAFSRTEDCLMSSTNSSFSGRVVNTSLRDGPTSGHDRSGGGTSTLLDHAHSDSAVMLIQQRQTSDPVIYASKSCPKGDMPFVQPHPPSEPSKQPHPPGEPSKDRQRRRIRVKGQTIEGQINGAHKEDYQKTVTTAITDEEANSSNNSKLSSEGDFDESQVVESVTQEQGQQTPRTRERRYGAELRDSGVGPFVPEIQSPRIQKEDVTQDDSMSDVIRVLKDQADDWSSSDDDDNAGKEEDGTEYIESDDGEENSPKDVYMFVSPPKSAPHRNISPNEDPDSSQSRKSYMQVHSVRGNGPRSQLSRGARPENDFMDSQSSSDSEETAVPPAKHKSGSRDSRPTSGTAPGARNRVGHIKNSNSVYTGALDYGHTDRRSVPREKTGARELKSGGDDSLNSSPRLNASMSRMSRKSLREINPRTDARLSLAKPGEGSKAYDHTKYQIVEDLAESFDEAEMLASLKRQQEEEMESHEDLTRVRVPDHSPRHGGQEVNETTHSVLATEESPTTTSDDDTSFSTWKAPAPNQLRHNYQEEMRYPTSRLSSDTLTSSNPRDWSGVFSPPIVLPRDQGNNTMATAKSDDLDNSKLSPDTAKTELSPGGDLMMSARGDDPEGELDLLYDPCLNCYFDPNTCKYYELA